MRNINKAIALLELKYIQAQIADERAKVASLRKSLATGRQGSR